MNMSKETILSKIGLKSKQKFFIIIAIVIFLSSLCLSILIMHFDVVDQNKQFMLYLASSIIQAYAALIVFPIAVSLTHYGKHYPSNILNYLLMKKSKALFLTYSALVLISVANIIYNPFDKSNGSQTACIVMLFLQLFLSAISLVIIGIQVAFFLNISPISILNEIASADKLEKAINKKDLFNLKIIISQEFQLIISSIRDIVIRDYLRESINFVSQSIDLIPWMDNNFSDSQNHLDSDDLLIEIVDRIGYMVESIKKTEEIPNILDIRIIILKVHNIFVEFDKLNLNKNNRYFYTEFMEYVSKVNIEYIRRGITESVSILHYSMYFQFDQNRLPYIFIALSINQTELLIQYFKKNKEDFNIGRITFPFLTYILEAITKKPEFLGQLSERGMSSMNTIIKNCDTIEIGLLIAKLAYIEKAYPLIENEYLLRRAEINFNLIIDWINHHISNRKWMIVVDEDGLGVLDNKNGIIERSNIQIEPIKSNIIDTFIKINIKQLNEG